MAEPIKPINPKELMEKRINKPAHQSVLIAINSILESKLKLNQLTIQIQEIEKGLTEKEKEEINWEDVFYLYEKAGWKVTMKGPLIKPESLTFIIP